MLKTGLVALILLTFMVTHAWSEPFKDNGNGTVTDLATGLTWQQTDDDDRKDWTAAVAYCQGLGLANGGWRLPTVKELRSIVDYDTYNPAINGTAFPGTNGSNYWSATTYASSASYAWYVYFSSGYVSYDGKAGTNYVRCVRWGQ